MNLTLIDCNVDLWSGVMPSIERNERSCPDSGYMVPAQDQVIELMSVSAYNPQRVKPWSERRTDGD
jgi:hypothetical protein